MSFPVARGKERPAGDGLLTLPAALTAYRCPHLIGGGGKTSLMYALAHAAVTRGETVITTTTTHIFPPSPGESPCTLLAPDAGTLRAALAEHRQVTVAEATEPTSGKLRGSAALIEQLAGMADRIIVEADGSAGRPLKAHAEHEPVINTAADAIFAVVGADALLMPLGDYVVHRSILFAERFQLAPGTLLTTAHVTAALLPPDGYAARIPECLPFFVIITKIVTPLLSRQANELATLLLASPRVAGVATGDLFAGGFMLRERAA